jgi:hypothetical protein
LGENLMANPWEKYQATTAPATSPTNAPWEKYQSEPSYGSKVLEDIKQTGISAAPVIGAGMIAGAPAAAGLGGVLAGIPVGKALAHDIDIKKQEGTTGLGNGFNSYAGKNELPKLGASIAHPYIHPIESLQQGKLASTALAWSLPLAMLKGGFKGAAEPFGISKILKEVPPEEVAQSIKTNTPLSEIVGDSGQDLIQTAKVSNLAARKTIVASAKQSLASQGEKLQNNINDVFGNVGKLKNLEDIENTRTELAKPAYEEAWKDGDLNQKISPVAPTNPINELITDKAVKRYIEQARNLKTDINGELEDLPDSHIKVLDATKQVIDDEMSTNPNAINKNRKLMDVKDRILSVVDPLSPSYVKARGIWETGAKLKEAQALGTKLVDTENPESISMLTEPMNPAEMDALKVGLRDTLMKKLGKGSMSDRANIAEKIFGDDTPTNIVRNNLKTVLGQKEYSKLMSTVDPLIKSGRNASELLGGSQTTEKTGLRIAGLKRMGYRVLNKTIGNITRLQYEPIAKAMTNPNYLKSLISNRGISSIPEKVFNPLLSRTSMVNLRNLERQENK